MFEFINVAFSFVITGAAETAENTLNYALVCDSLAHQSPIASALSKSIMFGNYSKDSISSFHNMMIVIAILMMSIAIVVVRLGIYWADVSAKQWDIITRLLFAVPHAVAKKNPALYHLIKHGTIERSGESRSEEAVDAILSNVGSVFFEVGNTGTIERMSTFARKFMGFPRDQVIGKHISAFIEGLRFFSFAF